LPLFPEDSTALVSLSVCNIRKGSPSWEIINTIGREKLFGGTEGLKQAFETAIQLDPQYMKPFDKLALKIDGLGPS
jgi:hypothetical protein